MMFKADRGGRVAMSYAPGDHVAAGRLAGALNRYRTPRELLERPTRYGFAPSRLEVALVPRPASETEIDLSSEARLALREADHLLVLSSLRAVEDRWIDEEIRTFLAHRRAEQATGRLHVVLLPGDPKKGLPKAAAEEALTPIADLSLDVDGPTLGARKALAALIGVDLERLDALEKRRRGRRLRTLATAFGFAALAAAGAALLTGGL